MGKAMIKALGAVLVIHIIGLLGLLVYGLATGRFEAEKVDQYLATWRGEKLVAPPEEEVVEEQQESPTQASKRIVEKEINNEIRARDMQRQFELLSNMRFTVELAQKKLEKAIEAYRQESKTFYADLDEHKAKVQAEGFQKALKSYSTIKPKLAKNDFMQMDDLEVVRYLTEMKAEVVTKILNQFKAPEEEAKRQRVLKLLHERKNTNS